MCGRIAQFRSKFAYAEALGWDSANFPYQAGDRIPHWNVPPASQPWLMHQLGSASRGGQIEMINWGFKPAWANEIGMALATGVRLDQAKTGPYFRTMFKQGRAVVPVDGWYEWTGVGSHRQPWYLRHHSNEPMFLAAICSYRAHDIAAEGTGFVIVCATEGGGILDSHDPRPIVLRAKDAVSWMNIELDIDDAEKIATEHGISPVEFEFFRVSNLVNKIGSNGPDLINPISTCISISA